MAGLTIGSFPHGAEVSGGPTQRTGRRRYSGRMRWKKGSVTQVGRVGHAGRLADVPTRSNSRRKIISEFEQDFGICPGFRNLYKEIKEEF
jgi:hypothetical protein